MTGDDPAGAVWSGSRLDRLLSQYLVHGYRREAVILDSVRCVGGSSFVGQCAVRDGAIDSLGKYHLSALNAVALASQMGVVVAHIVEGRTDNSSEVLVRDLRLTCRGQINTPDFELDLTVSAQRRAPAGTYFKFEFSCGAGAFTGAASAVLLEQSHGNHRRVGVDDRN